MNSYPYEIKKNVLYEDLNNWAAHPQKKDNSDSLALPFSSSINIDLCDIFFLHPTSFTDKKFSDISNASLSDDITNKKTEMTSILYQASVFNEVGRIYAPRYQQAHIERYYDTGKQQHLAFDRAYKDVKASFEFYLNNWNDGRYIIIAAHSQGTTHALRLIHEIIDNHEVSNRIVLFYLLGMPVRKREYVTVLPCTDDSTNFCFCSWRTYRKGYEDDYVSDDDTTILVTNPVDITAADTWAGLEKKKRAVLLKYNEGYEKTHDSKVTGNMLWITRPKFKGGILGILIRNYHAGDINLYYEDIREDIKKRLIHNNQGR